MTKNAQSATWFRTAASGGFNSTTGAGVVRGGNTPPGQPTLPIVFAVTFNSVTLNAVQPAAGSASIAGANWYRNGVKANVLPVPFGSWTDSPLAPSTSFTYTVSAVDVNGNEGATSASATGTTAANAGAGFFADPYASYPTRLVDPTIAANVSGGTTLTRTWNGTPASYQVYKTLEFAVADYFINAGVRLGLLNVAQHNAPAQSTHWIVYPAVTNGTLSASAMRVIQGDPAAATLPVVDCSLLVNTAAWYLSTSGIDNSFTVLRKFELRNVPGTGIMMGPLTSNSIIEWMHVHDCHLVAMDNVSCIYFSGNSSNSIVRNCKFHDVTENAGAWVAGCIESYWAHDITIQNNEFYNCAAGVEIKGSPSLSDAAGPAANGWLITRNIFHDMQGVNTQAAIWFAEQSDYDQGWQGTVISFNLAYNCHGGGLVNQYEPNRFNQGSTFTIVNNTVAEDCTGFLTLSFQNAVTVLNNVVASNTGNSIAALAYGQPVWNPATAYAAPNTPGNGNVVRYTDNLYYRCIAANTNQAPPTSPTYWAPAPVNYVQLAQCDYNAYWRTAFADQRYGVAGIGYGAEVPANTWAGWQSFHTAHPASPLVVADPDAHGRFVAAFVAGPTDVNFIDPSVRNYKLKPTSPLKGMGQGGVDPGYDPSNCGPGW